MNEPKILRMLIVVRDDLPPNHVALACAHGSIAAWFKWGENYTIDNASDLMKEWRDKSFRKVIRKATAEQFEQAKKEHPHIVMTESNLGGRETALVFQMAFEYPKFLNFLPKY